MTTATQALLTADERAELREMLATQTAEQKSLPSNRPYVRDKARKHVPAATCRCPSCRREIILVTEGLCKACLDAELHANMIAGERLARENPARHVRTDRKAPHVDEAADAMAAEAREQERRRTAEHAPPSTWLARLDAEAEAIGLRHIERPEPSGDELERALARLSTEELIAKAGELFENGFKQIPLKHTETQLGGNHGRDSERSAVPSARACRGVSGI